MRYQKMAKGLTESTKKHEVDVILLQEAHESMVPYLQDYLGEHWEIVTDEYGVISAYNTKRLTALKTSTNHRERIRSFTFKDNDSGLTVDVHNIWGLFSPFPQHMERRYRTLLTQTSSDVSVIMGDTNSRLAPLDDQKRNIVTGVIPPIIVKMMGLSADVQITDYPDGGFYRNESGTIHQLETQTLDFDSGDIIVDERSEQETDFWPEYRMVMCLDEYYQTTPLIGEETLFDYENTLKEKMAIDDLVVRMASDSYNNKALAIRFPKQSAAAKVIQRELQTAEGFQLRQVDATVAEDQAQTYFCVFAPMDKIERLNQAIETAISETLLKNQVAQRINSEITRLSKTHWYFRDASEKIKHLIDLRDRILDARPNTTAAELVEMIETWEEEIPSSPQVQDYNVRNKADLMGLHRNIFFSARREGVQTEAQKTLQWLKEALSPKEPAAKSKHH
ncbi:endonuclease/exonuclease/phosphatase family protein [Legionella jordanis]|nr:endonuclease/exonuclease/phosphatase family protein [Legionella jordanis]